MTEPTHRRQAVTLIQQAQAEGASLHSACAELGLTRRTYHRWCAQGGLAVDGRPGAIRPTPRNKLSPAQRQQLLDTVHQPAFASQPPGQIVPALADERGVYLASESTFYRVLRAAGQQHHRGRSKPPVRPSASAPHVAEAANQVWVWDISWLPSCVRGQFFYLYLVLDLYSRKIVAAEVFEAESGRWASELIHRAVLREGCINAPPVLHADNGVPMKGRTLQATLDWLGIELSFSRPRTCNDNAYAEATFRTLKYRPHWPVHGFDCLQAAREWVESFLSWYNQLHRHSALRYVTPQQRHAGEDRAILEARSQLYRRARDQHPERWSGPIRDWSPIGPVTLNSTGRAPAQVLQSS
jgi:transposase InsO family protein